MSDKIKRKFQNKCVGLTDDHRDYIYGTDWKGYAKALEKHVAWHEVDAKTQIAIINSHKKEIKAFEKQVRQTDCHCSFVETTGWTTFRLCNICGKIQEKK